MKEVNAFHKDFMKQENARNGNKKLIDTAYHNIQMSKFVENQRNKNANFGTMFGMPKKVDMLQPRDFNVYSRAGAK